MLYTLEKSTTKDRIKSEIKSRFKASQYTCI